MSPEERDLISGVFERMRSVGTIEKDREAETFINSSVRQIPDSAYMLVQSVLVQEQALQQADERLRDLEDQVNQMAAELDASRKNASSSGGSFLGGLFGGSKPAPAPQASSPWGSSVPSAGRRAGGFDGAPSAPQRWSNQAPQQGGFSQSPMQQPQAAQGGGFMKSAMTTAAGVAGGMLVAGAIGNMMRGQGESGAHNTSGNTASEPNYQEANSNDQGGTYSSSNEPSYQDASSNDQGTPGTEDAVHDDGGSDWGSGGGDIET